MASGTDPYLLSQKRPRNGSLLCKIPVEMPSFWVLLGSLTLPLSYPHFYPHPHVGIPEGALCSLVLCLLGKKQQRNPAKANTLLLSPAPRPASDASHSLVNPQVRSRA